MNSHNNSVLCSSLPSNLNLCTLPDLVLDDIFDHLGSPELSCLRMVCSSFKSRVDRAKYSKRLPIYVKETHSLTEILNSDLQCCNVVISSENIPNSDLLPFLKHYESTVTILKLKNVPNIKSLTQILLQVGPRIESLIYSINLEERTWESNADLKFYDPIIALKEQLEIRGTLLGLRRLKLEETTTTATTPEPTPRTPEEYSTYCMSQCVLFGILAAAAPNCTFIGVPFISGQTGWDQDTTNLCHSVFLYSVLNGAAKRQARLEPPIKMTIDFGTPCPNSLALRRASPKVAYETQVAETIPFSFSSEGLLELVRTYGSCIRLVNLSMLALPGPAELSEADKQNLDECVVSVVYVYWRTDTPRPGFQYAPKNAEFNWSGSKIVRG